MALQSGNDEITCPQCGKRVEKIRPYVPWCDQCNWNLLPKGQAQAAEPSAWDNFYQWLSKSLDSRLHKQMLTRSKIEVSYASWMAVLLSTAFYCLMSFIVIKTIGLGLSFVWWKVSLSVLLFLLIFWSVLPRFEVSPPSEVLTQPDKFPVLNAIVGRISSQLNVPTPKILMTEQFAATFATIGWTRESLLVLGYPWVVLLSAQELVGLIAHELSHQIDRNISRSLYVRIAETAVMRWVALTDPMRWIVRLQFKERVIPIPILPLNICFLIIYAPLQVIRMAFLACNRRNLQRSEYVADRFSAEISGNRESISLLRKSLYRYLDPLIIPYRRAPYHQKYDTLLSKIETIPPRELDRLWRISQLGTSKLLDTHPPMSQRAAFLGSVSSTVPKVEISPEEFEALHQELRHWPIFVEKLESVLLEEGMLQEAMAHFISPMPEIKAI